YIPDSELSKFNRSDSLEYGLPYMLPVLQKSKEVYLESEGAFDPTVGPLVNAWGFGPEGATAKDSIAIDSLLQLVGFDQIFFDEKILKKNKPGISLDFSAIAKGYAVDMVAE